PLFRLSCDKVFVLSDPDKIVNVFSYDVKSKQVEKLTNFNAYDVRTLQGKGNELIFEQAGKLHLLNTSNKSSNPISIHIKADALSKRGHYVDMKKDIRNFEISSTGQRALFESRGEIFSVPDRKSTRLNSS